MDITTLTAHLDAANALYATSSEASTLTSVRLLAAHALDVAPTGAYLTVDASDQGDFMSLADGSKILDATGADVSGDLNDDDQTAWKERAQSDGLGLEEIAWNLGYSDPTWRQYADREHPAGDAHRTRFVLDLARITADADAAALAEPTPPSELDVARAALVALVDVSPEAAYALLGAFEQMVREAEFPRLIVDDEHGICDYCGEPMNLTTVADAPVWVHDGRPAPLGTRCYEDDEDGSVAVLRADATPVLLDPYTYEPTTVRVVDTSERWTNEDEDNRTDDSISVDYGSTADYETLVYISTVTERPVLLPEGWIIEVN